MINSSCVIPVHNEAKYLPYSLASLQRLALDEFVFILDNCSDNSEDQIRQLKDHRFTVYPKMRNEWHDSCSEAKQQGCILAHGERVMITDADVILDRDSVQEATEVLEKRREVDIVIFIYRFYTLFSVWERIRDEWLNLFAKFTRLTHLQPTRFGVYMIRKDKTQFIDAVGQYDYFQRTLNSVAIHTRTLHLRPKRDKQSQLRRGRSRAIMPQYNVFKMILVAFLHLQPYSLIGYVQARRRK